MFHYLSMCFSIAHPMHSLIRTIRVLHVWLGYAILGILCILALIAPGMLRAGERSRSRSIATCQRVLGKMMYGLGMTTQTLGPTACA